MYKLLLTVIHSFLISTLLMSQTWDADSYQLCYSQLSQGELLQRWILEQFCCAHSSDLAK